MKVAPKVSVIVPIYNVEKYLRECVESILAQTLEDIEVILVDDGSPDNCPRIVDEYAAKDPRVVALHQPNGGYGVAVNNGIAAATGKYIGIIESDDWIEPDMYEKLYENARQNDSDVVKCSFFVYDPEREPAKQNIPWKEHITELYDAPDGAFRLADFPKIVMSHASIWAALYRADFVKKIKVIETSGASYQDFPFMCEVMSTANRISVCKERFVHWRIAAEGNSTSQKGVKLIAMAVQSANGIDVLKRSSALDLCREEIYWHIYKANIAFFEKILCEFKQQYFFELHDLFSPLIADTTFRLKYFPAKDKPILKAIMANDFKGAVRHLHWSWRRIRRALFSFRIPQSLFFKEKHLRLVFMGVQIALTKKDITDDIPCWKRIVLNPR